MKKNLTRFVYGFMLLIATSCGKNGTTPDPAPTPEPEPEPSPEVVADNLSKDGTSNCYLITKEGDYSFDATVRGNGAATEGLDAPEKLSPASAALVWETSKGMITNVAFKDGKITFKAASQPGNALIAACSEDKTIIWSWHIWFPEANRTRIIERLGTFVRVLVLGIPFPAIRIPPQGVVAVGRFQPIPARDVLRVVGKAFCRVRY